MARYWGWHNPHVRCWRQDGPKQDSVRHQDHSVPSTTTRHRRKSLFFLRDSSSEPSRKFDWYCSISLLKIVWLCLEDHMGKQGATQAALTPDKKVKLIKKKLTPSKAICHNDVEAEVDQTNKVAAWKKKECWGCGQDEPPGISKNQVPGRRQPEVLIFFNSFSTAYCPKGCRGRRWLPLNCELMYNDWRTNLAQTVLLTRCFTSQKRSRRLKNVPEKDKLACSITKYFPAHIIHCTNLSIKSTLRLASSSVV